MSTFVETPWVAAEAAKFAKVRTLIGLWRKLRSAYPERADRMIARMLNGACLEDVIYVELLHEHQNDYRLHLAKLGSMQIGNTELRGNGLQRDAHREHRR